METAVVPSRTRTVLVIEEDPLVASTIRNVIQAHGYRAVIAQSVAEASACFMHSLPALILLDWNLPDGSGEDVVRAVRPLDASVPIVVMSTIRDSILDSMDDSCADFAGELSKPFDLDRVVTLVRRYLG